MDLENLIFRDAMFIQDHTIFICTRLIWIYYEIDFVVNIPYVDKYFTVDGTDSMHLFVTWWRHQMETFSTSLAIFAGNSPVTGEFPAQRPVTRSFDVFFDLRLNKRLSKQSWG